jgi:hypothetical protein
MAERDSLFSFTPTEELILDVLAARTRLGEKVWTFKSRQGHALQLLTDKGLVFTMHGVTEATIRAGLTDEGKAQAFSDGYNPPRLAALELVLQNIEDPICVGNFPPERVVDIYRSWAHNALVDE